MNHSIAAGSFHDALRPILRVCQFFGILPVDNVDSRDMASLEFRWRSIKTIYSLAFLVCGSLECLLCFRLGLKNGVTLIFINTLSFYSISTLGAILMFVLARKWRRIMYFWWMHERMFLRAPYAVHGWSLKRKVLVWSAAFALLALLDRALYMSTVLYNNQQIIENCNVNESEFFRSYLIAYRQHLVDVIPYHIVEFPLYEWINILMTFSSNFMDLMIVLISLGLSTRFVQINQRLLNTQASAQSDTFWSEIRSHYYSLIDLVDEVDEQFAWLILICTGHNVFCLCTSIFESLIGANGKLPFEKFFFWFSFFFMCVRSFSALFCASKVNESAKITRSLIRLTPSHKWNSDLQRLNDTIRTSQIGLSGRKFFYITKAFILAMIGTVVKYELVLLDEVNNYGGLPDVCHYLSR